MKADRARQFLPFAALRGFDEMLREIEKQSVLLLIRYSAESSSEKRVFSLTISKVYQINSWRIILLLLLAEFDCSKNQPGNTNQRNTDRYAFGYAKNELRSIGRHML